MSLKLSVVNHGDYLEAEIPSDVTLDGEYAQVKLLGPLEMVCTSNKTPLNRGHEKDQTHIEICMICMHTQSYN